MNVLIFNFFLGTVAFFIYFAAMFNGLDRLMMVSGVIGLIVNPILSGLVGRKNIRNGVKSAIVFSSPALLFTLLSIGDALVYGRLEPLLFWMGAGGIVLASGLIGPLVVYWVKRNAMSRQV